MILCRFRPCRENVDARSSRPVAPDQEPAHTWLKPPLWVGVVLGFVTLGGKLYNERLTIRQDAEKHCYSMISEALKSSNGDAEVTKKNLHFLRRSGLIRECDNFEQKREANKYVEDEETPQYFSPAQAPRLGSSSSSSAP
jgi:hypothetical protein